MERVQVGIVGATGYTGVELLRLLVQHPYVEVKVITSRQEVGKKVDELFPSLRSFYDLEFLPADAPELEQCDLVFFATPHGVAMKQAKQLLAKGIRIIDLSADYRLKDIDIWQKWYGMQHESRDLVAKAVYGLPEMNREEIRQAQIVANPGCYPTAVILPLLPLLKKNKLVKNVPIIADCKSGVSGAGRNAKIPNLFTEATGNFKAYGVSGHRHLPEIKQSLSTYDSDIANQFVFVPHLTPLIRGMQATIYIQCEDSYLAIQHTLENFYQDEYFVDILPQGQIPETRTVKASNICRIAVHQAPESKTIVLLSVIDNLVKGAAGQAVQNMNIMFEWNEQLGLMQVPILP